MRQIMIALMVALLSFGTTIEAANAARFGGGGSSGKMSRSVGGSSYSSGFSNNGNRTGAQQQNAARNNTANAAQPRSGMSRFLGPLAGVLAGGLLASMLFGGHFSMPGIMDMLLIGAAIYFGYRFLKRRSNASAAHQGQQQNGSPFSSTPPQENGFSRDHHAPQQTANHTYDAEPVSTGNGPQAAPTDFDREKFLDDMRQRFLRLQKAWDANDMAQIQDNVTPEFYNTLNAERRKQPSSNTTEVVRLFVEMGHIQTVKRQEEATVLFHGVIREQGQESEFNETWHLIREQRPNEAWYLQGIEQND